MNGSRAALPTSNATGVSLKFQNTRMVKNTPGGPGNRSALVRRNESHIAAF